MLRFVIRPLLAVLLIGSAVSAQAEAYWAVASDHQTPQARKFVACLLKALGGKPAHRPAWRADGKQIAAFNRLHDTDLFGKASVFNRIGLPQGTRDYYAINYFEFRDHEADIIAQKAEALGGRFEGQQPVKFELVREGQNLAYVETPEMRKALKPGEDAYIIAKVKGCMAQRR